MLADLVRLEVHFRVEDHKLLLETLPVITQKVVFPKVHFQCVVVQIIMWLSRVSPVTEEAPLVLVAAVLVELISIIEALATEVA